MRFIVALLCVLSVACASTRRSSVDRWDAQSKTPLAPELDRVLRDYERAWQARDAEALARLFTDDGFVLSDTRPPVHGSAAIRESYRGAGGPLWLRALGAASDAELGYIVGVYGHEPDAPPSGKFVLALRRAADGAWLIAADIDNSIERK